MDLGWCTLLSGSVLVSVGCHVGWENYAIRHCLGVGIRECNKIREGVEIDKSESVIRPGRDLNDADGDERDSAENDKSLESDGSDGKDGCDMFSASMTYLNCIRGGMVTVRILHDSLHIGGYV